MTVAGIATKPLQPHNCAAIHPE